LAQTIIASLRGWNLERRTSAPLLPMVELMKNSAKPCVCAWVQMKMPTPNTTPTKLSSNARLRCVAKRSAM